MSGAEEMQILPANLLRATSLAFAALPACPFISSSVLSHVLLSFF